MKLKQLSAAPCVHRVGRHMLKGHILIGIAALSLPLLAQYPAQTAPPQQSYPPPQQPYPAQQPYPGQYPASQYPPQQQGPMIAPPQLDQLVQRIALYPDPLLAQILTASTYWNDIPDAAGWANQHSYLTGDQLARAISDDRLPWDPSVIALLPFPSVLDMMARDPGWTQALGNAVLNQRPDVMDSVQHERQQAYNYGYLRSNPQENVVVEGPGAIVINPVDPGYILVPQYNPYVVFAPPRAGFFIGGAITFGPRIYLGAAFAPWGWGRSAFGWRTHDILIDNRPWQRTWVNRAQYAHPYAQPYRRPEGPRVERHEVREHHEERREERRP